MTGVRGFFGLVVALIVPPSMPMQMYIFVSISIYLDRLEQSSLMRCLQLVGMICVGMAMGWGIGAAAMKAALAVRNTNVTDAEIFRVRQS